MLRTYGFAGTVTLSSNPPAGIQTGFSTYTITGGSGSSTLTISLSSPPNPDPATVTVTATSGGRTQTTTILVLNPPSTFTLSATPRPVISQAGQSAGLTVTASSLYGFTGTISLTEIAPSGLACSSASPSSLTLSSTTTSASSTLSCNASAGLYTLNVTGTSGLLHSYTLVPFTVQDFTIVATSPAVLPGTSAVSAITMTAENGFAGSINLSDTPLPGGLSCSAISPASVTLPLVGPAQSPSQATATLSCTATVVGTYAVTITGTSGTLSHSATASYRIQDFSIGYSVAPFLIVGLGTSGSLSSVVISSPNGASGMVSLSISGLPSGVSASFSPSQASLLNGQGTSVLTLSATSGTTLGSYTLAVTGSGGGLSHSTSLTLLVLIPSVSFSQSQSFSLVSGTLSSSFTLNSGTLNLASLSGISTVSSVNNTSGANLHSYANTIGMTMLISSNGMAHFVIDLPYSPYWLAYDCSLNLVQPNGSPSCYIARTPDIGHNGAVNILDVGIVYSTYGCSIGQSCYNPLADLAATGTINANDIGIINDYYGAPVFLPSLSLAASPLSMSVSHGSTGSSTLTLTSLNGFTGTLSLSANTSPATSVPPCTMFSPANIVLSSGGTGASALTLSTTNNTTPGAYNVTLTAQNGSLSISVIVVVTIN